MSRQNVSSGSPYEDVFGYCRAVRVGNTVHVAGTCAAIDDLDGADAYQQAVSALDIIQTALAEVGAGPEAVVRTVTYVWSWSPGLTMACSVTSVRLRHWWR